MQSSSEKVNSDKSQPADQIEAAKQKHKLEFEKWLTGALLQQEVAGEQTD